MCIRDSLGVLHALDRPMRNLQMIAADAVLSVGAEAGLLGGCGAATEIFTRAGRNICRWVELQSDALEPAALLGRDRGRGDHHAGKRRIISSASMLRL